MGSELPSFSPATTTASLLVEATGDSESDSPAAAGYGGWPVDADEGDAESCCGGEDGGGGAASAGSSEVLSWESWMRECCASYHQQLVVGDGGNGECTASATEDDAESDRLFWEACIAHGF